MGKNNNLVNRYKVMYQQIQKITPSVYASIAIALHRKCGWGFTRINDLFTLSQEIWQESTDNDCHMLEMCLEETGIELRNK